MNRRHFLFGVSALGLTACSQAERNLYSKPPESLAPLQPEPPRPSTTTTVAPTTDGLPLYVPEQDLPGLSFVAAATGPAVTVYSTDQLIKPTFEFTNQISSGGPLVFLVEDINDL